MSKSKGQHYLQASWAGHFFNYGNNINTSGQGRLKKLHVIDLKVVFDTKRKNINNLELENLIHTKKAENLFSGYEISLETEKKINVEKYEYIDYDKSEIMINGTFTDSFKKHKLPFMALQQSRNIQVFEYYKNIYNTGALNKDFYFQMAIQSDKNILHDKSNPKDIFNILHPFIFKEKLKIYSRNDYLWFTLKPNACSFGLGSNPTYCMKDKWSKLITIESIELF